MGALKPTSTAGIVRDMNAFYQPKNDACGKATPDQMALLLDRLDDYTKEVKHAADKEGLLVAWTDPVTGEERTSPGEYNAQFAVDMANWEKRLSTYRQHVDSLGSALASSKQGCAKIYKLVTAPLLDGIWYEVLDGVNLNSEEKSRIKSSAGHPTTDIVTKINGTAHPGGHSNPKPPDVVTIFSLGNQVVVFHEHQEERAMAFWNYLKESAGELAKAAARGAGGAIDDALNQLDKEMLKSIGIALVGVAAVGLVGYHISKKYRDRSDDLRRRRP